MKTFREIIQRELEVAFSLRTQPAWFRLLKWALFIGVGFFLYGTSWFLPWVLGVFLAGLILHLVFRYKTKAWTQPWGGWEP